MPSHQAALRILGLIVVVAACAARLVHLNADPSDPDWIGYITDEGRWNETARNLALFGSSDGSPNARLHLLLTPAYQAVNYVFFRWFGVDFWSARLLAALCGIAMIGAVVFALRRHVTPFALALGIVILGFESRMLAQSRMALPETPAATLSLLAFLVLILGPRTRSNASVAGLIAAVAVALKGTTLFAMAAFPLIFVLVAHGDALRHRFARALAFVAGAALPGAIGMGAGILYGIATPDAFVIETARLLAFLGPGTPYRVAIRFFDVAEAETRNLLLLGIWFVSWAWIHRERGSPVTRSLYLASGVWAAWWLIVWSGNEYLPGRYIVQWIVPATLHIMAGLSLSGVNPSARIAAGLSQHRGWKRGLTLAWLVLPSAVFVAAAASGLLEYAGWDVSRLGVRLLLIATLTIVLAFAARRPAVQPHWVAAFLFFPVAMALIWLTGRELGAIDSFWQFHSGTTLAIWIVSSALAFAACAMAARSLPLPALAGSMQVAIVMTLISVLFARNALALLAPTYSIRDASIDLESKFGASARVHTVSAESLFLANRLRFRAMARGETVGDGIVIFEYVPQARDFLASDQAANLALTTRYPVTVHPLYLTQMNGSRSVSIGVYKPGQAARSARIGTVVGGAAPR